MLPRHVYPVVPAQVPSAETLSVDVALALLFVDVLVDLIVEVEVVVGFVEDEDAFDELEEALTELELEELEQVPPTGLHPVPQ